MSQQYAHTIFFQRKYEYIYRITVFIESMNDDDGYPEPKAY